MIAPAADPLQPLLFYLLAALVVGSAWAIVLSHNIVRMAIYLLLTLLGAAGLYFLMQAELPAAIQLIVYAGGTLILIAFGVMLTSRDPEVQLVVRPAERLLAAAVGLTTAAMLIVATAYSPLPLSSAAAPQGYSSVALFGQMLLSRHLVAFELAGVLLLIVMVAAAYMARRRMR